jgi:hypothetical protein
MHGPVSCCPRSVWLVLALALWVPACDGGGGGVDAGLDSDVPDTVVPDAGLLPSCAVPGGSKLVVETRCEPRMCYRPTLALATDGGRFLLAYSSNIEWWNTDVKVVLLTADGDRTTEDAQRVSGCFCYAGDCRCTGVEGPSEPVTAVAWNSGWLLVWEDQATTAGSRIAASSLDASGAPVWPGITNHLLWQDLWVGVQVVAPTDRVDLRPALDNCNENLDRYNCIEHNNARAPAVVARGRGSVLSWTAVRDNQSPARTVEVGTFDEQGQRTMLDLEVSSAVAEVDLQPAIASSGNEVLIVWADRRLEQDTEHPRWGVMGPDIWGRFVRTDGLESCAGDECFLTDELPISPAPYASAHPVVVWAGDAYVVVWEDMRAGSPDVFVARVRVPAPGEEPTVEAADVVNLTATPRAERQPMLVADGDRLVMAWHQGNAPWDEPAFLDIVATWSPDGGRTWAEPAVVAREAETRPEAALAASGSLAGIAWVQAATEIPEDSGPFEVRFARLECQ